MVKRSTADRDPTSLSTYLNLGGVCALLVVIGLGLGWLADRLMNTIPIFLFVGLALGIAAAIRYLYVEFRKLTDDN